MAEVREFGQLDLSFPDGRTRLYTPSGASELVLPALAEFIFGTWREHRPWTLAAYLDYVDGRDSPALPGRGRERDPGTAAAFRYRAWFDDCGRVGLAHATLDAPEDDPAAAPAWQRQFDRNGRAAVLTQIRRYLEVFRDVTTGQATVPGLDAASKDYLTEAAAWLDRRVAAVTHWAEVTGLPGAEQSPSMLVWQDGPDWHRMSEADQRLTTARPEVSVADDPHPASPPLGELARLDPDRRGEAGFDLVARITPGPHPDVAATDLSGLSAAILRARSFEQAPRDPAGLTVLAHPDAAHDIVLEHQRTTESRRRDRHWWCEHNPVEGSHYYWLELGHHQALPDWALSDRHAAAAMTEARRSELASQGWQPLLGPDSKLGAVERSPRRPAPTRQQLRAAAASAATAEVMAALWSVSPRDQVAGLLNEGKFALSERELALRGVDEIVGLWSLAWGMEQIGIATAAEHRKSAERALAIAEPELALTYYRRFALAGPSPAMHHAAGEANREDRTDLAQHAVATRIDRILGNAARLGVSPPEVAEHYRQVRASTAADKAAAAGGRLAFPEPASVELAATLLHARATEHGPATHPVAPSTAAGLTPASSNGARTGSPSGRGRHA